MKKLTTILAALAICFAITINAFAQRTTPIPVNVVIDDTVSTNSGVQSDGSLNPDGTPIPYRHAVNSVQANVNDWFVFNSGTRQVKFIYGIPLDLDNPNYPLAAYLEPDAQSGTTVKTFPIDSNTFIPMRSMAINTSQCMGLGWGGVSGDVASSSRSIGYHFARGDLSNTAYVTVTRLDDNNGKKVWTLESVNRANCGGNNDITYDHAARVFDSKTVKNKTTDYHYGRYYMPFKLTLTAQ
jgi:hypothetical protein